MQFMAQLMPFLQPPALSAQVVSVPLVSPTSPAFLSVPPPIAGKTVVQNRQAEDEAYEYTGLLVFLIVILLGAAFGGCLLLMRLVASVSRRLGRRYGWKWAKRADSADLEDAIYYWKDHPDVFEQYHLDLLRDILASYGGSSYL